MAEAWVSLAQSAATPGVSSRTSDHRLPVAKAAVELQEEDLEDLRQEADKARLQAVTDRLQAALGEARRQERLHARIAKLPSWLTWFNRRPAPTSRPAG